MVQLSPHNAAVAITTALKACNDKPEYLPMLEIASEQLNNPRIKKGAEAIKNCIEQGFTQAQQTNPETLQDLLGWADSVLGTPQKKLQHSEWELLKKFIKDFRSAVEPAILNYIEAYGTEKIAAEGTTRAVRQKLAPLVTALCEDYVESRASALDIIHMTATLKLLGEVNEDQKGNALLPSIIATLENPNATAEDQAKLRSDMETFSGAFSSASISKEQVEALHDHGGEIIVHICMRPNSASVKAMDEFRKLQHAGATHPVRIVNNAQEKVSRRV